MTITITHSTLADGTFSASGAAAWNATHSLTGTTDIAQGGTGATTAATALTNLGAYPASNPAGYGTGTVTSVTGTSPVVSSGGTTPAISIPAATSLVSGYLTSTDWNTFNSKQPAGTYVTSVTGTTGRITSSGGATPAIDLASGIVTAGTTGSSTLVPVITVDTYGRVTSITTTANPQGTVTSVSGTGTVNGITLSGTVTSTGNLTLGGTLSNVSLSTQVTGNLPVTNLNSGTGASSTTYWRGDGTWATVSGSSFNGGTITNPLIISNTTASSSTSTGALQVTGGAGIDGNVWAGNIHTTANEVAIGNSAGLTTQGADAIAIGHSAGNGTQADLAISIGRQTGESNQGDSSIAIGYYSANTDQNVNAVAIGRQAGQITQGSSAIAIGLQAGNNTQGDNAIAIGAYAGQLNQTAQSIVINASGVAINGANAGLYINPVRNDTGNKAQAVYYNTTSKELTYAAAATGTVTSVTGTAPVVSSGGTTPAISMAAATTSVSGYLTSTDWNTFNSKGSGTVTSVAALTLGTTGTDLSSTVATGTTTPVITLNVPTASASNRGALSAADWSTFNGKQAALGYTPVNRAGDTMTGTLNLAAGTTLIAPLDIPTATSLMTTAAAGAVEFDGVAPYFSVANSTRGALVAEQWVVLTGTNTLTSQTAVQPIFDGGGGPTNGAVTLPIGTYQFECQFALTGMSSTSGSFGFGLAGAATKTFTYQATSSKTGTSLATAMVTNQVFGNAANTALQTATVGTVGTAIINGIIRVTVAGTVIPQVSLTTASAAIVQAGSYFRVSPIGNATVAQLGNWS